MSYWYQQKRKCQGPASLKNGDSFLYSLSASTKRRAERKKEEENNMKKRVLAMVLTTCMAVGMLAGCGGSSSGESAGAASEGASSEAAAAETTEEAAGGEAAASTGKKGTINLWAFTDEVPNMVNQYIAEHPDFGYDVNATIIATTEGAYQPALDAALQAGGSEQPDMYCAEAAFVLKYTKGDMESYAMPYADLGFDVDADIAEAKIAQYAVDIGTNSSGQVDALGYQATGGCFIYRRSIAQEVFGTDDPAAISEAIGGGSGSFDKFWEAAQTLADKGVAIVSGDGDVWHAIENSSESGWLDADGKLYVDPARESFLDISKNLTDNGWSNQTQDWQDAWFADMKGQGSKPVFGFFGPAWLINYTLNPNCGGSAVGEGTFGDWAVCTSPIGFFWGGTWIMANKNMDAEKVAAVAELIHWITLDCTEDGLQYKWANGTLYASGSAKDAVASSTVMGMSDGSLEFLGGQNMFEYFIPANDYANGKNLTPYDESINSLWRDQVRAYASGEKERDAALKDFKQIVSDNLGIDY